MPPSNWTLSRLEPRGSTGSRKELSAKSKSRVAMLGVEDVQGHVSDCRKCKGATKGRLESVRGNLINKRSGGIEYRAGSNSCRAIQLKIKRGA